MAFEELLTRVNMLLTDMENLPEDAHELLEQLNQEINQLRATGQPVPEDLAQLQKRLQAEFQRDLDASEGR